MTVALVVAVDRGIKLDEMDLGDLEERTVKASGRVTGSFREYIRRIVRPSSVSQLRE